MQLYITVSTSTVQALCLGGTLGAGCLGRRKPLHMLWAHDTSMAVCVRHLCLLQVIWNSKMREEVLSQMQAERREATAGTPASVPGHLSAAEPSAGATAAGTPTTATGFKFAALRQELVVAGVFVRVYNEQPNFPVADPAAFCKGLVTYIHGHMKPEVKSAVSNIQQCPLVQCSVQSLSTFGSVCKCAVPRYMHATSCEMM